MKLATSIAACVLALAALPAVAGPLTPPAGPVAPTNKTLTQVEPRIAVNAVNTPPGAGSLFTITQPGSYYLTADVTQPANGSGTSAIFIAASDVTLDLNGFTVRGGETSILLEGAPTSNITIRNGVVRSTSGSGIFVRGNPGPGHIVRNVSMDAITDAAILLGPEASVSEVRLVNVGDGVVVGNASIITNVSIEGATRSGFSVGQGSILDRCTVLSTLGPPTFSGHGFRLAAGAAAVNCVARSNAGPGFILNAGAVARQCDASDNAGGGFILASHTRLDRCTSSSSTSAPSVTVQTSAAGWTIEHSTITASASGISVGTSASQGAIRNNTIRGLGASTGVGILISGASTADITIAGNTISAVNRGITLDGVFCSILRNAFTSVGAAVVNSSGGAPSNTNFVAPILTSATAATATNPLVNTQN